MYLRQLAVTHREKAHCIAHMQTPYKPLKTYKTHKT